MLLVFFIIFIDQLSKILIKTFMYPYQQINIIGSFLRFTYIENEGIAFGIDTSQYHIYITILTFFAIFLIIYYYLNLEDNSSYEKIPILFIIGGAIGNAIDRLLVLIPSSNYKGVIDFIDMPNFLYYIGIMNNSRWFIFNIADCSITIGVVLYFILQYKIVKNTNEHSRNI